MTDRDRLIELLEDSMFKELTHERLADHLLANGVIVPPCNVGDTVYVVDKIRRGHWEESQYIIDDDGEWKIYEKPFNLVLYAAGNYFLTKEEAEAKLKEREGNG